MHQWPTKGLFLCGRVRTVRTKRAIFRWQKWMRRTHGGTRQVWLVRDMSTRGLSYTTVVAGALFAAAPTGHAAAISVAGPRARRSTWDGGIRERRASYDEDVGQRLAPLPSPPPPTREFCFNLIGGFVAVAVANTPTTHAQQAPHVLVMR